MKFFGPDRAENIVGVVCLVGLVTEVIGVFCLTWMFIF